MNSYKYSDIGIGLKESFFATVTEEFLEAFRNNTGDINPLHMHDEFARQKGFPKQVVFGMLTASYYSTLAGVYLPGEGSLLHSVDVKFLKPVYVGDFLKVEGIVTEKNDLFQIITVKAAIINQHNEKVSKAFMKVGII